MTQTTETKAEKVAKAVYRCDWCGKRITFSFFTPRQCAICGRHGHYDCVQFHDEPNDGGDYPRQYCDECWKLGAESRAKIELLEEAIEKEESHWHIVAQKAVYDVQRKNIKLI